MRLPGLSRLPARVWKATRNMPWYVHKLVAQLDDACGQPDRDANGHGDFRGETGGGFRESGRH